MKQDRPWVNNLKWAIGIAPIGIHCISLIYVWKISVIQGFKNELVFLKYLAQSLANSRYSIKPLSFSSTMCYLSVPLGNIFWIHLKFILRLHSNTQDSHNPIQKISWGNLSSPLESGFHSGYAKAFIW